MRFFLIFLFLFFYTVSFAQSDSLLQFIEVGIAPISYKGDLSHSYSNWGAVYHIGLKLNRKKRINGQVNIMWGSVSASNPFFTATKGNPNSFFHAKLLSFEYNVIANLVKKKNFSFYVSPGIGVLHFAPQNDQKEKFRNKPETRASGEDYSPLSFMIPLKIGAAYLLKAGFGIGIEAGWLNPLTDYIDNIGMLGNSKKDNLLLYKLFILIPLKI